MTISLLNSIKAKLLSLFMVIAVAALPVCAQKISTVAGGIQDLNGKSATAISTSDPKAVAVDISGNAYFSVYNWAVGAQIYKLGSDGIVTRIAGNGNGNSGDGGQATSAKFGQIAGMTFDSTGNLYIADEDNCVVREISNGVITTVAGNSICGSTTGSSAITSELDEPHGLAVDSSGNIYIADQGNCAIRKVSNGAITTVAGTGDCSVYVNGSTPTTTWLDGPEGVALYGSDLYIADTWNAVIRKLDLSANTITIVAGGGTGGYSSASGPATSASLSYPAYVSVDSTGNLYFTEFGYHDIRKVDTTGTISTVAGTGSKGYTGDGSAATAATLYEPQGIALDSTGNLYIADEYNYVIRKISSGVISTVAGNHHFSYSGDGGLATSAQLEGAMGIALDGSGNRYIADTYNCVIRKINASTGIISTVAGTGVCGYSGDGSALTTKLDDPYDVAVDNSGNLYIADNNNSLIRKVDASGTLTTVAGVAGSNNGLNYPSSVAVDGSGNVYIADSGNALIRKLDTSGNLTIAAGGGSNDYSVNGVAAISAALVNPVGVAVDSSGNLFITDAGGHPVVREVILVSSDANYGKITTVAGGGSSATASGALDFEFLEPAGVYVDASGSIFISDANASQVFKVSGSSFTSPASGTIAAVAGNGTYGYSGDGGPATSAQLDGPIFIFGDGDGNLLIPDAENSAIRSVAGVVAVPRQSQLSTTSLNFDTQLINSGAKATKTITVTNPGTQPLTVSSVVVNDIYTASGVAPTDFTESDTCIGTTVTAASSCTISVTFAASAAKQESTTLTITSNATSSPQTVSLSGAGITFSAPGAATGGSTSSTITSGGTTTYALQLTATGGSSTSDSLTFALSCSGAPTGATCTLPASATATPGTPATFTVTVATTKASTSAGRSGTLASLRNSFPGGMGLALIPFGAMGLGLARKRRKLAGILLLALLAVVISTTGCGSSNSKTSSTGTTTGTTAGTYTLAVKAVSGSVSQTTNLTLIVQ
ncbi:MAG: choice-of-anchor D domain-containing protein [Terracidiphilus sp.]|nr:choice-of-anchor D domain-containing protein [Terracidiphilus sp.]